ncbi:hypothetical protein LCGC14_1325740 [marine sediment metagenome]|uniref:Zinc-ribbon domain-containing protein n=1 Tax=marine sediment metagenome TaxID=412755 RepID=A0A0F9KIR7_9ZZZZ|nr:hypothetical protein [archaeon]
MAKFCHECGKPIQADWKLCPFCGCSFKITQNFESSDKPTIVFKSKGYFCGGKPKGLAIVGNMKKGFIILTYGNLSFVPKRGGKIYFSIPISEIAEISRFSRRLYTLIQVTSKVGKNYTFWAANMVLGQYLGGKTNELFSLLIEIVKVE